MADTKEFEVIRIARSDGCDTGPDYWPAPAAKKAAKDATEKATRPKPQMGRLAEDDPKFVEYRVKLGILLKQELSPSPDEGLPWYVQFPRGYWLYEKSKHLYVSGYPIKSKLFKTPQEFGVHLLWLISPSKSYKDCCCILCNIGATERYDPPDEAVPVVMAPAAPTASKETAKQATSTPAPTARPVTAIPPPTIKSVTAVPAPTVKPVAAASAATAKAIAAAPAAATKPAAAPPVRSVSTPKLAEKPKIQSQTQVPIPTQPQVHMLAPEVPDMPLPTARVFRVGDLVWYQHQPNWRLGIVGGYAAASHKIIPIGYGGIAPPPAIKSVAEMRPFHAYSVPAVAAPNLRDHVFDEISWENEVPADMMARESFNLDASKMAALKIEFSYSFFSRLGSTPLKMTYGGVFLGAERVELGDALRIKELADLVGVSTSQELFAFGLREVFEHPGATGGVLFAGPIYQLRHLNPGEAISRVAPPEKLPRDLREELEWRLSLEAGRTARRWVWELLRESAVLGEELIRGRFYPTQRLMPLVDPQGFQGAVTRGEPPEGFLTLNNRMEQSAGQGRYIGKRRNRLDALGATVPPGTQLTIEPNIMEDPVA